MKGPAPEKILFVTPPYHCGVVEAAGRWIPLNFVYLAGAARQAGVEAEIYDAMTKGDGFKEIAARLRDTRAAYVASSAFTSTIHDALRTLEAAKAINPSTITILGGIHPTFCYQEILAACDAVDYIVCGEGEATLKELLEVLEQGTDPATVSGIAFRRDGKVVKTAKRPLHFDPDDFPAAWDLLEWPDYSYFVIPGSRMGAVSTSRGCDHDCSFCSQQQFWQRSWRERDPQKVADEIAMLNASYGVNVLLVTDEDPTRDAARWEALLDDLIAKEIPVHLLMETTSRDILRDRDILWKYRKAGVVHITIGIEAGPETLESVKGDADPDQYKQALDLLHQHGIVSEATFMVGFPDDTAETIDRTLQLARHYNPDNAHFLPVTPWPYSEIHDEVKDFIEERDYAKYNLIDPIVKPKNMTLSQVETAIVECYRKFYMGKMVDIFTMRDDFRRSYVMRAMKLMMTSPFILKKLTKGALAR